MREDLTLQDVVGAGRPAVKAQGTGAVRASALVAIAVDPSPLLRPAVLLDHRVIADERQANKPSDCIVLRLKKKIPKTAQVGMYLSRRLVSSSLSSQYNKVSSVPVKLWDDGLECNQASVSGQGRYLVAPSSSWNIAQVK